MNRDRGSGKMKILLLEGEEADLSGIWEDIKKKDCDIKVRGFEDLKDVQAFLDKEGSLQTKRVSIVTFGLFNVFVDKKPLEFRYSKTEELFAILVDRRGLPVSMKEAGRLLWQESDPGNDHASYLSRLKRDMLDTFSDAGIEDIFRQDSRGLALITGNVSCDLYDYLEEGDREGVYEGRYMEQYYWAEPTAGLLYSMTEKKIKSSGSKSGRQMYI